MAKHLSAEIFLVLHMQIKFSYAFFVWPLLAYLDTASQHSLAGC